MRAPLAVVACAVVGVAVGGGGAAAQAPVEPERWPAPEIGARFGYDNTAKEEVVGAVLRIPVLRNGHVELMPGGDVTFLRGLEEYQLNLEAVYLLSGRDGGFYGGGGIGWRNTLDPDNLEGGDKVTLTTLSVVAGIKLPDVGPLSLLFEFRRIISDDLGVDPQLLQLGATLPLW